MKAGVIEQISETIDPQTTASRSTVSGGSGSSLDPGGPKGPGNGGYADLPESEINTGDKSRIITAFVLLVVLMTFGGLLAAYAVLATNRSIEWSPFDLPVQVWMSTAIILASSITYGIGQRAIFAKNVDGTRKFMVATAALGGVFVASQLIAWVALVQRGYYMEGNPYAGFFYILTAVHALHVIGGVVALGTILLRSWYPAVTIEEQAYRENMSRSIGWYWHFVGGLWIVLLLFLGLWK
jgi:cytochrome c oxidase subunit 3